MKLLVPSSLVPSRLLVSFTPYKSLSSASFSYSAEETTNIPLPNSDSIEANPSPEPQNSIKSETFQTPISENTRLSQSFVVDTLLSHINDPSSALEYFKWVEKQRGFVREIGDSFFVLIHILVSSRNHNASVRNLLNNYLSSDFAPSGAVLVDHLINCSDKFGFGLKPPVFSYSLNGYVKAQRYRDAEECFNALVSRGIKPCVLILNHFLNSLLKESMIDEARGLFRDIISKKLEYDCATIYMMMCASLREGKVKEAEKYFMLTKNSEIKLDPPVYYTAIRAACMKLDSNVACSLLNEMKEMGWVPPEGTFTHLICTCVKQRNMVEALRLKDEMINIGHSMNLVVATSLMKGYYQQGDLHSSLALFDKIVKDGLAPNKVTYAVLIEGCCINRNMVKARELYMQMKFEGIPPTVYIVSSLIRGYLQSQLTGEATELFDEAVKDGITNIITYNNLISWFCEKGRVDDACRIWDKMIDQGVEPTVVSYNNMILGNCRKGNMDVALDLLSEMTARNLKANNPLEVIGQQHRVLCVVLPGELNVEQHPTFSDIRNFMEANR
ncbi:hypothetical protein DH2020_006118 [Rehmannia glutinosa]|uniref:Pentatricopeptide repeat-containing protein n=1 Tax=Rehmannia glutinosa TaxID=99300 RepID=A0ABR0XHZ9_REHGL